jgi:branched-chain amino acid transport system permease protein
MPDWLQTLLNSLTLGLSTGAIYALIAVGYTMVYGVLRLINFAHGDVYMVGAMVGAIIASTLGIGTLSWITGPLIVLAAMAGCGVLGFLIELLAYRPMRQAPRINSLITAIGVSMLLMYGGQAVFGATPRSFPQPDFGTSGPVLFQAGGVSLGKIDAMIIVVTLVLMLALRHIILHTRAGMALRAISHRFDTASLMGINLNRIISFTFVLGSVLAAAAGVLIALKFPRVDPLMGLMMGLKAFVAAVLGGIGNIAGAVLGGILLGITEVMVVTYIDGGSQWRDGVAFAILIAVLLLRPSGLLGEKTVEKV